MASSEVICKSSFGFSTICKIADLSPPELSSDFKFSCSSLSLVQFFLAFFITVIPIEPKPPSPCFVVPYKSFLSTF